MAYEFPELQSGDIQLKTIQDRDVYRATKDENYDIQRDADNLVDNDDWSGMYFAIDETTADDYGSTFLSHNRPGIFYLNKVTIDRKLTVLQIKQRAYGLGGITGEEKAAKLKEFFRNNGLGDRKDQENPASNFDDVSNNLKKRFAKGGSNVMATLGAMKIGLQCPHDEEHDELILYSNNVGNVRVKQRLIKMGFTNGELETFKSISDIPEKERTQILASRANKSGGINGDTGLKSCTKGGMRRCGSTSPKRKHG